VLLKLIGFYLLCAAASLPIGVLLSGNEMIFVSLLSLATLEELYKFWSVKLFAAKISIYAMTLTFPIVEIFLSNIWILINSHHILIDSIFVLSAAQMHIVTLMIYIGVPWSSIGRLFTCTIIHINHNIFSTYSINERIGINNTYWAWFEIIIYTCIIWKLIKLR
jgi:hypothetical protein